jgi:type I restriction enzyme R subunit
MIQSESQLETSLVKRLNGLGWEPVTITDGAGLRANLKAQL